jgi:hypothetical protein
MAATKDNETQTSEPEIQKLQQQQQQQQKQSTSSPMWPVALLVGSAALLFMIGDISGYKTMAEFKHLMTEPPTTIAHFAMFLFCCAVCATCVFCPEFVFIALVCYLFLYSPKK